MANQSDGFDEIDIATAQEAITYIEGNIELQASEIQIIKKDNGPGYKGRVKF